MPPLLRAHLIAHGLLVGVTVALATAWTLAYTYGVRFALDGLPSSESDPLFIAYLLLAVVSVPVTYFMVLGWALRSVDGPDGGRAGRVAGIGALPIIEGVVLLAVAIDNTHLRC